MNTGLLLQNPSPRDWSLGGLTGLPTIDAEIAGDWRPYRDDHEVQHFPGFDTMSCVSFAALNCIEAILRARFGLTITYSDRALAVMSGTSKLGNYLNVVADIIRKQGIVPEASWPYYPTMQTWEDYHAPVPSEVTTEAGWWLKEWSLGWEWVWPETHDFETALLYSPLQVALEYAPESWKDSNGVYQYKGANRNHANHSTALLAIDAQGNKYIQDHYAVPVKKLSPDYPIPYALRYHIEKRIPNPPTMTFPFKENYRYFFADGPGMTLFFFAGKLRKDDLTKCLDQWFGRNKGQGNILDKQDTILMKDLEGVQLYDLKNNPVSL